MRCTVTLTKIELMEAVQEFIMGRGFDEEVKIVSMKLVGFVDTIAPNEFQFEVDK